jgi:hypothetical protein
VVIDGGVKWYYQTPWCPSALQLNGLEYGRASLPCARDTVVLGYNSLSTFPPLRNCYVTAVTPQQFHVISTLWVGRVICNPLQILLW